MAELQKYITINEGCAAMAATLAKKSILTPEARSFFLKKAQSYSYLWLKGEVQLGNAIRNIKSRQGRRYAPSMVNEITELYRLSKIREDIYNRQIDAIADEKIRINESIARYKEITKDIKATVDNLLDIAGNLSDIMHNATPNKQNKLLKLLIKDCTLNGKELKYTVKAPFDKFIQCENPTQWFKDPTSDIETYTNIADEVKMVKQQVLLTC